MAVICCKRRLILIHIPKTAGTTVAHALLTHPGASRYLGIQGMDVYGFPWYTGIYAEIRALFAEQKESRIHGFDAGRFSFNRKGGRCEACQGQGLVRIEMHFLPDVYTVCELCGGRRFNPPTLRVRYRGHDIAEVLDLSAAAALELFARQPRIAARLQSLVDVGLDYLALGQPANTLSGGEAQRIKLARELSRRQGGPALYVLDEPTTGLHFDDVARLLAVLQAPAWVFLPRLDRLLIDQPLIPVRLVLFVR